MKILGFNGSPNEKGNTYVLMEGILNGAKENGADTQIFNLNKMKIKGCQSCMACKQGTNQCSINDDMKSLYEEIKKSDGIIIGTPIYMWQMTGQTKTFVDRLFAFFNYQGDPVIKNKKLALAFTHGSEDKNMFKDYMDNCRKMFEFLGFSVKGVIAGTGTQINPVKKQSDTLTEAEKLGREITD